MPGMTRRLPRWPALCGLTLGCVFAHAALLGAWAAAPQPLARSDQALGDAALSVRVLALPVAAWAPPVAADVHVSQTPPLVPAALRKAESRAVPPATTALPPPAAEPALPPRHWPTDALDMRPLPRSAPDERHVDGALRSGLPIRVRVFVEADGSVSDVNVLDHAPGDEEAAAAVAEMFRETAFIPGRLGGSDVAAFIDIELALEAPLPAIPLQHY